MKIWPDKTSNRLIVAAPKSKIPEVKKLIDLLDTEKPQDVAIRVITLKNVSAEDLVKALRLPKAEQPLVIQVGFRIMFQQAHIPGAEYIGPGSEATAIQQLHARVQSLPRDRFVVLYCGCCPWERCPNVKAAAQELVTMGFKNMKVLYIANNFGADWADKGYPVARAE